MEQILAVAPDLREIHKPLYRVQIMANMYKLYVSCASPECIYIEDVT